MAPFGQPPYDLRDIPDDLTVDFRGTKQDHDYCKVCHKFATEGHLTSAPHISALEGAKWNQLLSFLPWCFLQNPHNAYSYTCGVCPGMKLAASSHLLQQKHLERLESHGRQFVEYQNRIIAKFFPNYLADEQQVQTVHAPGTRTKSTACKS